MMIQLLKKAQIKHKLIMINLFTTGVALLLSGAVLGMNEFVSSRDALLSYLAVQASILANNCAAPLAFNDQKAASETLRALKASPNIECAIAYDKEGKVFADYCRDDIKKSFPPAPVGNGHSLAGNHVQIFQGIVLDGEKIGSVYIRSDLKKLYSLMMRYGIAAAATMAAIFALALALLLKLQKMITGPLSSLAQTMHAVSRDKNYALKAHVYSEDEIGSLAQGFNEMLEQIQIRDLQLQTEIVERKRVEEALLESEKHYRALFEASPDAIALLDFNFSIVMVNQRSIELFEYGGAGELIGKNAFDFVAPEDRPRAREYAEELLATGSTTKDIELTELKKNGEPFPCWLMTSLIADADGKPAGILCVTRDITERKRVAEEIRTLNEALELKVEERTAELERQKKAAEAANRAKSDFLANMSHELRTPLNAVIGFSEVMRDGLAGTVNNEQYEYLTDIWESGRHLLRLINDILDIAKIEAGKAELELTEFSLKNLLEGCLIMLKEKAMRHAISLTLDVAGDINIVMADELKIKQVVFNLLSNALKFTPDGGKVTVAARNVEKSGGSGADFVEISVTDTGIGIAREDLAKLFTPFQQLESTLTKKYEGTGLGLAICKTLVELHGGRIRVESEPGRGSLFTFMIPAGGSNA